MCAALLAVTGCTTVTTGNSETQLFQQFVHKQDSNLDLQSNAGPDDRLKLAYASADTGDDLNASARSFDLLIALGKNQVKLYRYRDPASGKTAFFDAKGNKIGQYLLRNPVPDGKKTSGFGMRRHPILGYTRMHSGVDWSAPAGTPILAAADGVVSFKGRKGEDGNQIVIDHGNGYQTSYSHQSKFAANIKVGTKVSQGEVIGYVGRSGLATGPHLHYEVVVGGKAVDPMKVHFIIDGTLTGTQLARFEKTVGAS